MYQFKGKIWKKGVLALALVMACMIPTKPVEAAPTYSYQGKVAPEVAIAFTKVLENDLYPRLHVTPLGYPADVYSPDYIFDACTLVDFENDNVPELLVIYQEGYHEEGTYSHYDYWCCEVWRWNGKTAERIFYDKIDQMQVAEYDLTKVDGKIYFIFKSIDTPTYIYGIQNHQWKQIRYLESIQSVGDPYMIDDRVVSSKEFHAERERWMKNAEVLEGITLQDAIQLFYQLSQRYATPSSAKLKVDGKYYTLDSYTIEGNNYFKVRDIAQLMVGTSKEASVQGDASGVRIGLSIDPVVDDDVYVSTGSELKRTNLKPTMATRQITENYSRNVMRRFVSYTYTFDGYKYFPIRELGYLFDFDVQWDNAEKTIVIDTTR